ncbi:MAG: LytTR family DNA-binding domain-containing protein [Ferruginibacter sp.]|nr:response regulator transcription factor [Ferruginibacter sp.]
MKVLIIEDEEPAAKRLQKMIVEIAPNAEILDTIVSVTSAIRWFNENKMPDLILSDIQLSDGISFDIFKSIEVTCPVIFTTAFDQYAIDAFKINTIDYLLKPIKKEALQEALVKHNKLSTKNTAIDFKQFLETYNSPTITYKKRFVVRYGEHIKTINIDEVAFFFTEDKVNFLTTTEGRRYTIEYNLDSLETIIDPKTYFRINRQYIIGIHAITEMFAYTKSRVLIKLNPPAKHETIVSTERSAEFKLWLGDEK